ncbi:hypothetical protein M378DRAFT_166433 [Amanita muscaria Koide BX008]|uniref:Uncharacterized protein n=1 Tax=Amanita muscaria (strain Koide BX008) TaxID=946122 RepID=A0A0C2WY84_AMAMK|nr:hypothetical protein M378DRAFT_166433 [Amanita muscaria Koide BX008]
MLGGDAVGRKLGEKPTGSAALPVICDVSDKERPWIVCGVGNATFDGFLLFL